MCKPLVVLILTKSVKDEQKNIADAFSDNWLNLGVNFHTRVPIFNLTLLDGGLILLLMRYK